MANEIKPGETATFDCPECNAEFSVTYEPKCVKDKTSAKTMKSADVTVCPLCGAELDEDGDDDSDDE